MEGGLKGKKMLQPPGWMNKRKGDRKISLYRYENGDLKWRRGRMKPELATQRGGKSLCGKKLGGDGGEIERKGRGVASSDRACGIGKSKDHPQERGTARAGEPLLASCSNQGGDYKTWKNAWPSS